MAGGKSRVSLSVTGHSAGCRCFCSWCPSVGLFLNVHGHWTCSWIFPCHLASLAVTVYLGLPLFSVERTVRTGLTVHLGTSFSPTQISVIGHDKIIRFVLYSSNILCPVTWHFRCEADSQDKSLLVNADNYMLLDFDLVIFDLFLCLCLSGILAYISFLVRYIFCYFYYYIYFDLILAKRRSDVPFGLVLE